MPSLNRVLGLQLAFVVAISAPACQRDSDVNFDDSHLSGAGANQEQGADPVAGDGSGGSGIAGADDASTGNEKGGSKGQGGKPATGAGGNPSGGNGGGGEGGAGKGGLPSAGSGGLAGASGAGAGMAGSSNPGPEPVTVSTRDIDDTYVAECRAGENMGAEVRVVVDLLPGDKENDQCRERALFTVPLPEIPAGATLTKASLTLACLKAGGPFTVSYVDQPWAELITRWHDSPKLGDTIGSAECVAVGNKISLDLTDAALAWLGAAHANYGIYLSTESSDGAEFGSSEAKAEASRPLLSVTYLPAQ